MTLNNIVPAAKVYGVDLALLGKRRSKYITTSYINTFVIWCDGGKGGLACFCFIFVIFILFLN